MGAVLGGELTWDQRNCRILDVADLGRQLVAVREHQNGAALASAPQCSWRGVNLKHGTWRARAIKTSDPERAEEGYPYHLLDKWLQMVLLPPRVEGGLVKIKSSFQTFSIAPDTSHELRNMME